ncbi:MAG: hypothetical protein JXA95_15755 [Spirochaetales bacterium]|nr:hypothetical protein [Spirochaetales bacterium]
MKILKPGVYLFLALLIGSAALLMIHAAMQPGNPSLDMGTILVWTVVAVLSESFSVYYVNGRFFVSPVEAVFYAAYLAGGPLNAGASIFLTFLLIITREEDRYRHLFNTPPRFLLFNISHLMIIMLVLDSLLGLFRSLLPSLRILPVLAMAPLFFTFSCLINAVYYKVEEGSPFRISFKKMFSPFYQTTYPASLAAVIIGYAYPRYGLLSLFMMLTPLFVSLITMKAQARNER